MRRGSQEWWQPARSCAEKQAEDALVDHDQTISALNVVALPSSSPSLTGFRAKPRRSTFSLSLPWQSLDRSIDSIGIASVASDNSSISVNLQSAKKRFTNLFPELATTSRCASLRCSSSLETPPLTPPDHHVQSARRYTQALMLAASSGSSTAGSNLDGSCSCVIHEYTCALERETVWQGTLYVTATHVCFYGVHAKVAIRMLIGYKNILSVCCLGPASIRIQGTYDARTDRTLVDEAQARPEADFKSYREYVLTGFTSQDQVLADIEEHRMVHGRDTMALSEPSLYQNPCSAGYDDTVLGKHHTPNAPVGFSTGCNTRGIRSTNSSISSSVKSRAVRRPFVDLEEVSHWDEFAPSNRSGSSVSVKSSESQELFGVTMDFNPQSASLIKRSGCSTENSLVEVMTSDAAYAGDHNSQRYSDRISAPIPIQPSSASASIRGPKLKAPTPPPSLLSPSLTTTKVSRSSPMVRGVAKRGSSQEPPIRLRIGPRSDGIEEEEIEKVDRIATSTAPSERSLIQSFPQLEAEAQTPTQDQQRAMSDTEVFTTLAPPQAPCGCTRHYKYPILSTVVPTSLEKCFEALFSARGMGQGDLLVSETLRSVNGSTRIKITPWTAKDGDNSDAWEGKIRTLKHSSILKAHHSNNARTDCRETQRVLEYSPHTIRVLSDVWPNLSGGHPISLLSQICLSWNSPGYTRIKCFTEVEYTRAPSWVSAYEADLLEPIDRFYKELIRRLVESIDKRDALPSWSATTSTASNTPSATGPVIQHAPPLAKAKSDITPSTFNTKTSQPQDPQDSSPALSLLSQQLRKHTPAQFKQSRASMESERPIAESVEQPNASHALTAPIARKNKAAALILQAMFPASILPTKNMPIISEQAAAKNRSRVGDLVVKSDATTAILWAGLLQKGISVFKTATNRTAKIPFAGQVVTSDSEAVTMDHANKSTFALSIESIRASDKSKSETEDETVDSRLSSTATSCCTRVRVSRCPDGQHLGQQTSRPIPSYTILRIIFIFFAVGMVVSAMNVWHLYSAVSSVVDMLQLSHGSICLNDATYEQHQVGIQRDTYQKQQRHYLEALAPIQKQKELLRAEIIELMFILDSARRS